MDWEKVYKELRKINWIVLLALVLISCLFGRLSFTAGVVLGGLIILANFHVFQLTLRKAFPDGSAMKATKQSVIIKYYLRLLGLGVIMYFLIRNGWADPVGLAIGLSTVGIGIFSFGVKRAIKIGVMEAN
jgi:hypothetical protein